MIKTDYHIHTNLSPDAYNTMEEVTQSAIKKGLCEIAVTNHFEFYKNRIISDDKKIIINEIEEIKKIREKYSGKIKIKCGIEFGQPHLQEKSAYKLSEIKDIDYIIGSVHKLNDVDIDCMKYDRSSINYIYEEYFKQLLVMAEKGEYDCIGHLDLPKRYAARSGMSLNWKQYENYIYKIIKTVISRGKGIEINSSGLRQKTEELPCFEIVKLYVDMGGKIITVGSDSHNCNDLGSNFDVIYEKLKKLNINNITIFEKRNPCNISI